jgi:hypothetical protein
MVEICYTSLCTVTDNREFRPIKFKPRLLYNNGLQDVPDTALGIQTGQLIEVLSLLETKIADITTY